MISLHSSRMFRSTHPFTLITICAALLILPSCHKKSTSPDQDRESNNLTEGEKTSHVRSNSNKFQAKRQSNLSREALLRSIRELAGSNDHSSLEILGEHLISLSRVDPAMALEILASRPDDFAKFSSEVFSNIIERDAEIVANWLRHVDTKSPEFKLAQIAAVQFSRDPSTGLDAILGRPGKNQLLLSLFLMNCGSLETWQLTLSLIDSKVPELQKSDAINSFLQGLSSKDSQSAMKLAVKSIQEGLMIDPSLIGNIFQSQAGQSTSEVFEELNNFSPSLLSDVLKSQGLLISLSKKSPEKVIDLLNNITFTSSNLKIAEVAVRQIGSTHPELAITWIGELPLGKQREELTRVAIQEWSNLDPDVALSAVNKLSGAEKLSGLTGAANGWVRERGLTQTLARAESLRGEEASSFLKGAFLVAVVREPAESVKYLTQTSHIKNTIGEDQFNTLLASAFKNYARADLDEALGYLTSNPQAVNSSSVGGISETWIKQDPVALSEWLGSLPPGESRDRGARILVDAIRDTDPERAEKLRKSIESKN